MLQVFFISILFCLPSLFSDLAPVPVAPTSPSLEVSTWKEDVSIQKQLKNPTQQIAYTAKVGSLSVPGKEEGQSAKISFIAYTSANATKKRPITFCFNGGPGCSSVWVHMGLLGPKKVIFPSPITEKNYQGTLVDNPDSLLSTSDLVFIDPIATGFSTFSKKSDSKEYFGVDEDVSIFAQFIERYLTQYQKWDCPKYLLGESYGTIRAVLLAKKLHETYRFDIDGLVLISQALDIRLLASDPFEELSLIGNFPTIVLAAQSEKLLPPDLQNLLPLKLYEEAKQFANRELLPSLLEENMPQDKLSKLSEICAKWTALPSSLIEKARLRFTMDDFRNMILIQKSSILGRFDTRVHVFIPYHNEPKDDPSLSFVASSFTSNINQYFIKELGLKEEHPYCIMSTKAHQAWNWQDSLYPNYTAALQDLFSHMPALRIYTALGLFDDATPPYAQELMLSRITIENKDKQIQRAFFEGGHMMYLDSQSGEKLSKDLRSFIK